MDHGGGPDSTSSAVSLEIDRYISEPCVFTALDKGGSNGTIPDLLEFLLSQFEAYNVLVKARTKNMESDIPKGFLARFDLCEAFGVDRCAVGESRTEAGKFSLLPGFQGKVFGENSNIVFGQTDLYKRRANPVLAGCLVSRTVVAQIVQVGAVQYPIDSSGLGFPDADCVELGLAKITAIRRIGRYFSTDNSLERTTIWLAPIHSATRIASRNSERGTFHFAL